MSYTKSSWYAEETGTWPETNYHMGIYCDPACNGTGRIAKVEGWGEQSTANALLIAAAPDLLAALRLYVEVVGGVHDTGCPEDDTCDCKWKYVNDQVDAAISKAEGRT